MAEVHIRPCRLTDAADLISICIDTADSGRGARGRLTDDEILPYIYALPYVSYAPSWSFVVDTGSRISGYIVGVPDVASFVNWWRDHWVPVLRERFGGTELWPEGERELLERGLNPDSMWSDLRRTYEAEFHIDLLSDVQGRGLGTQLLGRFTEAVTTRSHAHGIAIGVDADNSRAIGFYAKNGLEVLREDRGSDGAVSGYTMGISLRGPSRSA